MKDYVNVRPRKKLLVSSNVKLRIRDAVVIAFFIVLLSLEIAV